MFQFGDVLKQLLDFGGDLFVGEALADVLFTIDVPGSDVESDGAHGFGFVVFGHEACDQIGIVFDKLGSAPDLDALLGRIVHQENDGFVIF